MRSGKVIGTVGLFAVVLCIATAVHSRQNPRGGPLAALPISFVLGDGNGNIVGNVIDLDRSGTVASTLVEVELSSGDRANVLLTVRQDSGFRADGFLIFSGADCTGDVFVVPSAGFLPAITASAVIESAGSKMLYVASTDTPVSVSIRFYMGGFGCSDLEMPITLDLLPAELVDSDIEMTFPPPYTLEIE